MNLNANHYGFWMCAEQYPNQWSFQSPQLGKFVIQQIFLFLRG